MITLTRKGSSQTSTIQTQTTQDTERNGLKLTRKVPFASLTDRNAETTQTTAQQAQTGQQPTLNTGRVQAIRAALPSGVDAMQTFSPQKVAAARRENSLRQLGDEDLTARTKALQEKLLTADYSASENPLLTVDQKETAKQEAASIREQLQEIEAEQTRRKTQEWEDRQAQTLAELESVRRRGDFEYFADKGRKAGEQAGLDTLTEAEKKVFYYYVGKGDDDGAANYITAMERTMNERAYGDIGEKTAQWAQEHPALGAAANVVSWPFAIPAYVANAAQTAKNAVTGDYEPTDVNSLPFLGARIGTGTSQGVAEAARQSAVETFGNETAGDVAAFLAQTGLSIGQNVTQIAALGPYSLAAMSLSAAGTATTDALERGATPQQAFLIGTADGAIEALTEKLPLDNLFEILERGGKASAKTAVLSALKQVFTEAGEEAISEIAGNLVDTAIMREKSEYQQFKQNLIDQGVSESEAEKQAFLQFYIVNVGLAGLGGGISGGVMGGGANLISYASYYADTLRGKNRTAVDTAAGTSSLTESSRRQPGAGQLDTAQENVPAAIEQAAQEPAGATEEAGNTETPAAAENAAVEAAEDGTGLVPLTEQAERRLATGKNNIVAKTFSDIVSFVKTALTKKGGPERLYMGTLPASTAELVRLSTGLDVTDYNAILPGSSVQHIFNQHGNEGAEATRGHRAVTAKDIALIPQVLAAPDTVTLSDNVDAMGRKVLLFSKQIGDTYLTAQAVTDGRHALTTDTLWIQKKKNRQAISDASGNASPRSNVQDALPQSSSENTIPQQTAESNTKNMDMADWLIEDGRRARAAREGSMSNEQQAAETAAVRDDLSGGGEGRVSGEGAGGEAVRFPSRAETARQTAEQSRTAVERQNRARDLRLTKTSAEALGIIGGSANNSLTVLPEGFDQQLDTLRQQIRTDTGRDATFVLGGIRVSTADGGTQTVRGVYASDGLIIQADNLRVSAEQIWQHEDFHDRVANTPGLLKQAVQHVLQVFDREQFKAAVDNYMRVYGPLYGLTENVTQEQYQEIYNKVLEEVLADAYAGINAFGADATRYTETVRETVGPRKPVNMVDLLREDRGQRYSVENTEADARTEEERRRDELTDKAFNFRRVTPVQETETPAAGTSSLAEPSRRQPGAGRLDSTQENVPATGKKATATSEKTTVSKATIAKKDFRQNTLNLFSIPAGQRAEVGTIIDKAADRIVRDGALTQAERDALFDKLYESGAMEVPADEYFQMGREAVKGGRVYVDEKTRHEFFDDWNDFRKRAFANGVYFTNDPNDNHIDTWNMELAETLPGLFDASELSEREILERIVQVAEEGKAEKMSLAEYTARLAGYEGVSESEILDGMERQLDYQLRSFAEKAGLEIKLKDRQAAREATDRNRRQESAKRQSETRALRELQQKTLKQLQWLSKNRNKAPAELRAQFDDVLGDLDVYAASAADEMHWDKRFGATWRDLADMYETAKKSDPNFIPSDYLQTIVDRLDARKIAELDVDALNDLYKAAVGLRTELYNRKNMVADEEHRLFSEIYDAVSDEIKAAPGGWTGKVGQKLTDWMLTPMNRLEKLAGWKKNSTWMGMVQQLEKGERKVRDYVVRANAMMDPYLTQNEDFVKLSDGQGKTVIVKTAAEAEQAIRDGKAPWYEIEVPELVEFGKGDKPIFGDTIKVYQTPAQKVHMYLESKSYDNLRHMEGGRTFILDPELYSKGERHEALAQGRTIRLAPETVKALVADMTEQELAMAKALEPYYNDFSAKEINAVSNPLYGYDKAIAGFYAPIFGDSNYGKTQAGVYDVTAEGVGHMKGRVPYAKSPSYNISALDAFEQHVKQTSMWVGMTIPIHNWETLMNWSGNDTTTKKVISQKWGDETNKYIKDLMTELQNGKQLRKRTVVDKTTDTALSNYISSVFGANPSMLVKQTLSFPLAATYLGWENVPNVAAALKTSDELINTYTSELAYRLLGYSTPETAQLKNNPSALSENKVLKNLFGGGAITAVDGATVKTLWRWSENAVRRDNPNLEVGTQEQVDAGQSPFYQEVARRFEEAVSRSQPMYDVMHRSDAMRSEGAAVRALTMFKTVPMQQYNMLVQTANEAKAAKTAYDAGTMSKAEYVQTKRKAGRAVTGVILAGLGIEAMNLLFALWKNRGKKYRDEDGELTWQSAGMEFLKGFVGDNLGMIVGGDLLYDVAGSLITGDKWYGIETPGITQIEDVLEEIISAGKVMGKLAQDGFDVVKNGGDLGAYLKRNQGDYLGALNKATETAAAYLGGVPAGNLRTYILGAVSWAFPEAKTAYEDAMATADKTGLKGLTGDALEVRMGDILKNRLGESDEGTVAALAGLYEAGYAGAAPTDTPASITVNGESHKLSAYQKQLYDMVWKDVVGSQLDELVQSSQFQRADQATQEKLLKKLYSYGQDRAKAELFEDYEGSSTVGKLMDAGLDQRDALSAALAIDGLEPPEGKSTVSDAQKAQAVAGLGLDEQQTDEAVGAILSESAMSDYEAARAAGLDPETYLTWKLQIAWYESKDTTGDGKKDLTKQAQVVESIDKLPITKAQKDTLYLTEYTAANLGKTPWH